MLQGKCLQTIQIFYRCGSAKVLCNYVTLFSDLHSLLQMYRPIWTCFRQLYIDLPACWRSLRYPLTDSFYTTTPQVGDRVKAFLSLFIDVFPYFSDLAMKCVTFGTDEPDIVPVHDVNSLLLWSDMASLRFYWGACSLLYLFTCCLSSTHSVFSSFVSFVESSQPFKWHSKSWMQFFIFSMFKKK